MAQDPIRNLIDWWTDWLIDWLIRWLAPMSPHRLIPVRNYPRGMYTLMTKARIYDIANAQCDEYDQIEYTPPPPPPPPPPTTTTTTKTTKTTTTTRTDENQSSWRNGVSSYIICQLMQWAGLNTIGYMCIEIHWTDLTVWPSHLNGGWSGVTVTSTAWHPNGQMTQ